MRYVVLTASIVLQVCLGGLYAWSAFVPALRAAHGLSTAQTQFIFGVLIATFTVVMVAAGRLQERFGPRPVAMVGGVLFGAGYLAAGFSDGSFLSLTACIGLLAGAGTGFCYVCPLAACVRWFPSHKGLVTGLAVAGFGGGAVLLASWADALLARGLDVLAVFRWIGLTYGAAILAAACALSVPARRFGGARRRGPTAAALFRDRVFWALALGMFAGTFAGLLVVGNLKPMAAAAGVAPWWAALAIGAFAVGNATGRITWGFLADRLGSRAIPLSLAFLVAATLCLLGVRRWDLAFAGGAMLVGFGFGACFVVYAAHVASRYGPDRVGTVYPPVFLAYGLAGIVGPAAGGFLLDLTGTPLAGLVLSAAVAAVGATAARRLLRPSAGAVRLWSAGAAVRPS